ncbi:beta-lactamase domain-containing protein [Paenibacillus alvei TS-15]|uniref:Beta-lactamase domain-containing protein n=1 Tax=Paenibacillus alvei TS-15 TaxID=1117108 RepID=S9SD82_PAEAL|nr:MBL fold metallo-hydrolase [Paenibacillus alvei]EPY03852.1 beta-lactamase domain-containing protein [Paenibacillus alvei TS-15]
MEISKGVYMLELDFHGNIIHPTLLWDQEMTVLIDTGFPGQIEDLRMAMQKVGVSLDKLNLVILTHQDIDHIGCLPDIGEQPLLKDRQIKNPPKGRVDNTLHDGQELACCGGIQVIHTPGHTPGHISLYLKRSKTLIAGDSLYSVNGMLGGIHEPTTLDIEEARHSLQKVLNLNIESIICYHGGLSKENINDQIRKFA